MLDLPEPMRAYLDQRLIGGGFRDYVALEEWLRSQGFEIGKSSIHRYGSKLEMRIQDLKRSTEEAKAIVAAAPDDAADMSEALMRLLQAGARVTYFDHHAVDSIPAHPLLEARVLYTKALQNLSHYVVPLVRTDG